MKDFSFQGKVYLGLRGSNGKPLALAWVDDASQLQVKLTNDIEERQESYSGNRLPSVRMPKAKKAEFSLTLNAFSKMNLATALSSTPVDVATGSVTGEVFPSGLAVGDVVALDHRDISALAVTDSNATPATLTLGTNYSLESGPGGLVKLLNLGAYTQPFKGAYTYADSVRLPMFTAGQIERYLLLDGINTVSNERVRVRLYRCSFDPVPQLDLITDALSSLQLGGGVLYDSTNAADANLGGFGRIEMPKEV
jgi:hypothetical protein